MKPKTLFATLVTATFLGGGALHGGLKVVSDPGAEPECFAPWDEEMTYMQWSAKEGPYRIAVVNGEKVSFSGPAETADAGIQEGMERLQIKAGATEDTVQTLSGGNQQKVVLAKWLMIAPDVILMNDPTRGIDVGTTKETFRIMRALEDEGKSILFYSFDYAKLVGCSDRVIVLNDCRVVSDPTGDAITEEAIVSASLNIHGEMA